MKLSDNFTLDEFLVSQTAERTGIDMTPSQLVIGNLRLLVESCLQPLREECGPLYISSGFRPVELNTKIGGSQTSQHCNGNAADFKVIGMTPYDTCLKIIEMELPFDQVIHEFGRWVHLGVADTLRGEQLTAHKLHGKTQYVVGIIKMEEF